MNRYPPRLTQQDLRTVALLVVAVVTSLLFAMAMAQVGGAGLGRPLPGLMFPAL
jgi:hypothetical protein